MEQFAEAYTVVAYPRSKPGPVDKEQVVSVLDCMIVMILIRSIFLQPEIYRLFVTCLLPKIVLLLLTNVESKVQTHTLKYNKVKVK